MNPKIDNWREKRVWIIGASSGIGAELARALLDEGALVALSARNADALRAISDNRAAAMVIPLDVTDHISVAAACHQLMSRWTGIDLVLVVAGSYHEMRADTFKLVEANRMLDVNLRGVLHSLDCVLPIFLAQGYGALGIVSSVAGYSGLPGALIYGPTKAALINLCESLYLDLRPRGIGVYLINPGFVDTPLTAKNQFVMPAMLTATAAAREIMVGLKQGQFHIHFPKRFTNWVRLARLLPYRAYFWIIHKVTGL